MLYAKSVRDGACGKKDAADAVTPVVPAKERGIENAFCKKCFVMADNLVQ